MSTGGRNWIRRKWASLRVLALVTISVASLLGCRGVGGGGAQAGASPAPPAQAGPVESLGGDLTTLAFRSSTGAQADLKVRLENTEPGRERGLMNITGLRDNEGDLFMWQDVAPDQDVLAPFWMKDTLISLTIAFVSADGRILEEQDMFAQSEALHFPHIPYRYAIEANLGWYARHGLLLGSTVNLPAALPSPG